jgi:hypothetical protein
MITARFSVPKSALAAGLRVALGAVSLVVLAGCSGGSPTAGARHAAPVVTVSSSGVPVPSASPGGLSTGLVLPLEAYMENYPERHEVSQAEWHLAQGCMARLGFTVAIPFSIPSTAYDEADMARRYGVMDPALARTYGYHVPGIVNGAPPPSQAPMSAAEQLALTGPGVSRPGAAPGPTAQQINGKDMPAGGCMGQAMARLHANFDASLPGMLDMQSLPRAQAEPQVQAVIKAWSSCMASQGYSVDSPFHADSLAPSSSGPSPTAQEIQVAMADVGCKAKTNLVRVWFDAEAAIQKQQIEQNNLTLNQLRSDITAVVKAAASFSD